MILFNLCCAWLLGISTAALISDDPRLLVVVAAVGIITLALYFRRPLVRQIALYLLVFAVGGVRQLVMQPPTDSTALAAYNDQAAVTLRGTVESTPAITDSGSSFRYCVTALNPTGLADLVDAQSVAGCALVTIPIYGGFESITFGDSITMRGALRAPSLLEGFDFGAWLARSGLHSTLYDPTVIESAPGGESFLKSVFAFRDDTARRIRNLLPSPLADLLIGMTLGDSSGIPGADRDAFSRAGTAHTLAISGANISALGVLFLGVAELAVRLARIRRRWATLIAIPLLLAYALFCGATPSTIRAAIMAIMGMVALTISRRADGLTSLAFSAFILTLLNPAALFDSSLLLSAAAVLGLMLFTDPAINLIGGQLDRITNRLPGTHPATGATIAGVFVALLLATVFAQIMLVPLTGLQNGGDLLRLLAVNVLIAPVQPVIITLGLLTVIAVQIWTPLAELLAQGAAIPIRYTLQMSRAFAENMGAAGQPLPITAAILYYTVIVGVVWWLTLYPARRVRLMQRWRNQVEQFIMPALQRLFVPLVISVAVLLLLAAQAFTADADHAGTLIFHVLPAEGTASLLLRTPTDALIVINAGNAPRRVESLIGEALPFRLTPDVIMADPDPTLNAALPLIAARYPLARIIVPLPDGSDLATYQNPLIDAIQNVEQGSAATANTADRIQPIYSDESLIEGEVQIFWRTAVLGNDTNLRFTDIQYQHFRLLALPVLSGSAVRALNASTIDLHADVVTLTLTDSAVPVITVLLDRIAPQMVLITYDPGRDSGSAVNAASDALSVFLQSQQGRTQILILTPTTSVRGEVRADRLQFEIRD